MPSLELSRLEILYEDEWFAVINKPANCLSVPGRGTDKLDSILHRAECLFGEAFAIHRLDEATSGLILVAKTHECQKRMYAHFREREVQKEYRALLRGHLWVKKAKCENHCAATGPTDPDKSSAPTNGAKIPSPTGKKWLTKTTLLVFDSYPLLAVLTNCVSTCKALDTPLLATNSTTQNISAILACYSTPTGWNLGTRLQTPGWRLSRLVLSRFRPSLESKQRPSRESGNQAR
ncbi:pseudouridine synthase [Marinomonas rhodophyticola]|uniref:pseudouridine synthase n=1 Tax=Marinomonas rhodophyticola TaxID=2992803 RepID=UPI003D1773DD